MSWKLATTPRATKRSNLGFTLIELLVVIAIILLLAAILFPVFSRVRDKARQSTCQSNLKQIGLGILQYAQDNNERLPNTYDDGAGHTDYSWRVFIEPYIKGRNVFACPSNPKKEVISDDTKNPISYASNYSTGNTVGGSAPMSHNPSPLLLIQISNPEMVWMVTEETQGDFRIPYQTSADLCVSLFAGHSGMANWLFVDGHVKALKPSRTGTPVNMWIPNATGPAPSNGSTYILDKLKVADACWSAKS